MLMRIIKKVKNDGIGSITSAITHRIKKRLYEPKIIITPPPLPLKQVGTAYGGKKFVEFKGLQGSTIVSCGLGEDATFDVEFAKEYSAKVIIVDPTPRAVEHYNSIIERIGQASQCPYSEKGAQIIEAYDLSSISGDQLILEKFALWSEETTLKFFAPANPLNVSYSITNFQNNYSLDEQFEHIEVPTKTMPTLMKEHSIDKIPLLKLDIEGAEIEVIKHMLANDILPTQICVEFDGLNCPSPRAKADCQKTDAALRAAGYLCYYFDGYADFLYILEDKIKQEL